jgi:periplasmic divalent cation tolerance protein
MTTEYQIILCTFPQFDFAKQCAHDLVEQKLAACVNILPLMTSVYAWQGNIETAQEHLLIIKTQTNQYAMIENWLKSNHPYEVPEIIALPIAQGLPDYLNWISSCHVTS